VSGLGVLTQSQDMMLRKTLPQARSGGAGVSSFAVMEGGNTRFNSGSHVDVKGFALQLGAALNEGANTLGAFVEAGRGNYNSYNSFAGAADVQGSGKSDFYGLGLMARHDYEGSEGHVYVDASLRAGQVKTDFASRDFDANLGNQTKYDSRSNYLGSHLGVGYLWQVSPTHQLDLTARYLWNRQGKDSVTMNTGDAIDFGASTSQRGRVGARLSWTMDETIQPYVGGYYDREFDGKSKGTAYGLPIDSPSVKGDTGIAEIGVSIKPTKDRPLLLEAGVQGYTGMTLPPKNVSLAEYAKLEQGGSKDG
jgi:hypothetical protein